MKKNWIYPTTIPRAPYNIHDNQLQTAYQMVLEDLKQNPLFCGKCDTQNGNENFMYGISTVMECIAFKAGDTNFEEEFLKNMLGSEGL